jgi:hypothetical protein
MTFQNGSVLSMDLGPDLGYLAMTGNLVLGGANDSLELTLLPGGPAGVPREIIEYDGSLTGEFASVTPGFVVDYSQADGIWVTAAPEPGMAGMVVVGVFGAMRRKKYDRGWAEEHNFHPGNLFTGL